MRSLIEHFFFSSRRLHTRLQGDWSSDVCSSDLPALAEQLLAACEPARTIVAYHARFERECIQRIAAGAPALAPRLARIAERLVDLLPIVREHVYHPAFGGSFSLKRVLPALVPGLGYDDLAIADGALASVALERLLWGGDAVSHAERGRLRADLQGYCARDTLGLSRLLERLRSLAEG